MASKTWLSAVVPLAVVLAGGLFYDYRLPGPPRAGERNRGRSFEHRSRLDAKGVEQVWVPPGCFEMGTNPIEYPRAKPNETPRHTVCLSAGFWLDRYEITNESFAQFVREGGYTDRRWWSDEGWRAHEGRREPYPMLASFAAPRQPQVKITWYEAEAYANWRGGRLPTEAQWEWAARGPESRRYPWGDRFFDGAANMDRLDLRHTLPVGTHPAGRSWCGAEDMAGNAWEWTADGYDPYAYRRAVETDPYTPPEPGGPRVIRGGAWGGAPGGSTADIRCARRAGWAAADRKLSHGTRVLHPEL
jgi:formylglycine-generating enzyme required for sulfatase activity